MVNKFTHSPVFPIVPCYNEQQQLDVQATMDYAGYLVKNGAEILMTTSGTTQYNLLSNKEIFLINVNLAESFPDKTIIMGLKAESFLATQAIIREYNQHAFDDNVFLMLQYPERYYNDDIIERYFHILAECSDYPLLIHCKPLAHGVIGMEYNYTYPLINKICSHKNIVGIKEETSSKIQAVDVVEGLNKDIGVICSGGSQYRYSLLEKYGADAFLSGVGSIFPQFDINMNAMAEGKCFDVFFKHGWHLSLRYALQHLKLIPLHDRQPWPSFAGAGAYKEIENIVDEIKGMI